MALPLVVLDDYEGQLAGADIVSVHLRLSDESRGLLDRQRLPKMKPTALLINTSRGAVVDEDALVEALREKRIAGAGLDVFTIEPLAPSSPLRSLPNVLLTPHIGWQLEAWLRGRLPAEEVLNPEAAEVTRQRIGGIAPADGDG